MAVTPSGIVTEVRLSQSENAQSPMIRVCRGTSCHSGGNKALMEAVEKAIGGDHEKYDLGWVECLGQCQDSPAVLINGQLHTSVDPEKIPELLKEVQA